MEYNFLTSSSMVLYAKYIQVEFHWHLSCQFSITLDLYLQIKQVVASLVTESLQCNSPDWCLKHACPVCSYNVKFPLAIVAKLLDVFGDGLGGGYDIGCQFQTTLDNSSLGPLTRSLCHMCLVGAFHGHAHRQLCQLFSLTTYIKGLGIKDLETCE
ncbi:hypothetical protein BDR07DRAFT_1450778 [Suillus spraguei]|nr:hypothetical protein BDR07DRAFT_1450778 [Suillus spraguei]